MGTVLAIGLLTSALIGFSVSPAKAAPANPNGEDGHGANRSTSLNLVPVITSLNLSNGQLLASGVVSSVVKGEPFFAPFTDVPVTLSVVQAPGGPAGASNSCPVLDLQLGPIHLDVLGLVVDTSPICLTLTAYDGAGLLGNLLCNVANLLNNGTPLGSVLGGLAATDLNNLLLGLTAVLNGALANLSQAVLAGIVPGTAPGSCNILNLTLGPLNLNLLGLGVVLDNCANGPVAVNITGQHGALLGNLLCGLLSGNGLAAGTPLSGILGQLAGLPAL